ncbi:MAG: polysaccharide biosynthesis protein [Flavobacteriales bacterium]|nr:polysaccharide biosynthesis protein [Flavobacteriales bacterium]
MVLFSIVLSYYFFERVGNRFIIGDTILYATIAILSVYSLSFVVFRTFSGIIRHSTLVDVLKILLSNVFSMTCLFIVNFICNHLFGVKIFLYHGIFIFSLFTFLLMFLLRLFVKEVYDKSNTRGRIKEKVLILGDGNQAISLAQALSVERPKRFIVKAFISTTNKISKTRKTVLNIPIITLSKTLHQTADRYDATSVIICDRELDNKKLNEFINDCLDNNLKIYSAPIIDNYDNKNVSKSIKNFKIQDLLNRKPIQLNFEKLSSILKNKVVLISGAAGSIGSEIVRQVVDYKPSKVVLIDIAESPLHDLSLEIKSKLGDDIEIISIVCDVSNLYFIEKHISEHTPNIIYHAAAYKHVPLMELNPKQAFITNVIGSKNMADLAVKYKASNFVMVSTDKAVNPSNVMGASKRMAELYIKSLSQKLSSEENGITKFTTTRFGNVLGSNGSVVPLFRKQIREGGPLTITHPEITRYFMTIPEACQLVIEAGSMGKGGEIYVFDMGEPVKIVDLAKRMIQLAGFEVDKDIQIKFVGLRPGEKLYEELITQEATTLPTHHPKIMIMKEEKIDYNVISSSILDIKDNINIFDPSNIVLKFKQIIPEFISMNSEYEKLDKK